MVSPIELAMYQAGEVGLAQMSSTEAPSAPRALTVAKPLGVAGGRVAFGVPVMPATTIVFRCPMNRPLARVRAAAPFARFRVVNSVATLTAPLATPGSMEPLPWNADPALAAAPTREI